MSFSREPLSATTSQDKPIFAFRQDPPQHSITILQNTIYPNALGKRSLPAGQWVAKQGNAFRFLPHAKVETAIATSSPSVVLSNFNVFKPGDVIRSLLPQSILTLSGSFVVGSTIALTVAGRTSTLTPGQTVLANVASTTASLINSDPVLSQLVWAVSAGALVYIYGNDGLTNWDISVSVAGGGAGALDVANLTLPATPIGTVQSINPTNSTITLSANAGLAAPAGSCIGVVVDSVIGIHGHSIDMTYQERRAFAVCDSSPGVYLGSLPYYAPYLADWVPQVLVSTRF
jgi:hypothetical protein